MTAASLSTVFGPFFLRASTEQLEQVDITAFQHATGLLKWMIEDSDTLFRPAGEALAQPNAHRPRSQEGLPTEMAAAGRRKKAALELPRLAIEEVQSTVEIQSARRKGTTPPPPSSFSPPVAKRKMTATEDEVFRLTEDHRPPGRRGTATDATVSPPLRPREGPARPDPPPVASAPAAAAPVLPAVGDTTGVAPLPLGPPPQAAPPDKALARSNSAGELPPDFWRFLFISLLVIIGISTVLRLFFRLVG